MFKINKNKKAPAIASPENRPGFQVLSQCYCTYEGELIIISVNSCLIMNQKKKRFQNLNHSNLLLGMFVQEIILNVSKVYAL